MLENDFPNYKLIKNFDASGKIFQFRLSKHDCYRLLSGKCSVNHIGSQIESDKLGFENRIDYCRSLAKSLSEEGVTDKRSPVMIIKNSCGHYSIENGQHRLCAATNAGVRIDVYFQENECECYICGMKKRSPEYEKKEQLGENKEFFRQL